MHQGIIKDIIERNNLDTRRVLDVCYAICLYDRMFEHGKLMLDYNKLGFTASADSNKEVSWDITARTLGLHTEQRSDALPYVQRLRVICDALYICIGKKIEGVQFQDENSMKVVSAYRKVTGESVEGVHPVDCYGEIEDCYKVLELMYNNSNDYSELFELEEKVVQLGISDIAKEAWASYRVSTKKSKFITYGDNDYNSEFIELLKDSLVYTYEKNILEYLGSLLKRSKVKANYVLNQLQSNFSNIAFGTYSSQNRVPRLGLIQEFPEFMRLKVQRLFNGGMTYDFEDLSNLVEFDKFLRKRG